MMEKILYYLVLPFSVVFFCIFGLVGSVYALEVGEVETRQINGGRFYHSFLNENNGIYSFTQNSSNKYGFYDYAGIKVYGIADGINGNYTTSFQFYGIPINTQNTEVYQSDLSIHFTFRYAYYKSDNYNIDNLIPFMSYNLTNFVNDPDAFNVAKDLIGFNGELFDSVDIDQDLLKTNYLFFYYPRVAQSCNKITDTSSDMNGITVCDVTFNFPSNYFQDIPINDLWFGFWNLDKTYKDDKFGGGKFKVFNDYKFWYEKAPEPTPTPNPVEDIKDSLTSEELPDVNNAFSGINLDNNNAISDLVLLPIKFLQRVLNLSSGICENWDLDFGLTGIPYKLHLPCLNVGSMLGTQLWNTIDFLCCFFMIYNIIMLMISAFEDITSLRDTYNCLYQPKHAEGSYQGKHVRE